MEDSLATGGTAAEQALGLIVPALMAIILPLIIQGVKKLSFWPSGYNVAIPLNGLLSVGITLLVAPWLGLEGSTGELIVIGMAIATSGQTAYWFASLITKKNGGTT